MRIKNFKSFNESLEILPMNTQAANNIIVDSVVKTDDPDLNEFFTIYIKKDKKKGNRFYFVGKNMFMYTRQMHLGGSKLTKVGKPTLVTWTYCYDEKSGRISRGNDVMWSTQEIRSDSKAFNKGNPKKMAIPNDFDKAAKVILNNYLNNIFKENPELRDSKKLRDANARTGLFESTSVFESCGKPRAKKTDAPLNLENLKKEIVRFYKKSAIIPDEFRIDVETAKKFWKEELKRVRDEKLEYYDDFSDEEIPLIGADDMYLSAYEYDTTTQKFRIIQSFMNVEDFNYKFLKQNLSDTINYVTCSAYGDVIWIKK